MPRHAILSILALAAAAPAQNELFVPIRNITRLHGVMANGLEGLGLVTGLNGTGSSDKAARQAATNYIRTFGLNVDSSDLTTGSFSLVQVSAELPPFAHEDMRIDVTVAGIGDATSLFGGRLVRTVLKGPDGKAYAVAEGGVSVGGVSATGANARVTKNHVTTGKIPGGGTVIRAVKSYFLSERGDLELRLINPSLATAQAVATAVNRVLNGTGVRAGVLDRGLVRVVLPEEQQTDRHAIRVLGLIRDVRVPVENPAVVVIDEARGVVLAGEGVMISPCVVALGDLTVSVIDEEVVSQPLPGISQGTTEKVGRTRIEITTESTDIKPVKGGATVSELLANLRALELSPRQLIEVFQALASGGYLHAELRLR